LRLEVEESLTDRRSNYGLATCCSSGQAHTFVNGNDDCLHFVVQAPFVAGDKRSA
jgi:hypothetical protein